MPLDTIYLTRHGHRLNWTIDYRTGQYHAQFQTPTGNPADPTLTSHGVRQSHELAAHLTSPSSKPKPFRVYCSPFYRCLQTIQPSVEALKERQKASESDIDGDADLDVRIENGLGEWFGPTTFFDHPSPAPSTTLQSHFPTLLPPHPARHYEPLLAPSTRGETIAQLHDRVATVLAAIIAEVDAEVTALEASQPPNEWTSKAILICSHAAPLIAMGRSLTGCMPADSAEEDFMVYTAGLSTFSRRASSSSSSPDGNKQEATTRGVLLAEGTRILRSGGGGGTIGVPDWRGGKGVGGGWDCVANGDCSFLSQGAERGWHFNGEESFDTGPMAASNALPTSSGNSSTGTHTPSTKL